MQNKSLWSNLTSACHSDDKYTYNTAFNPLICTFDGIMTDFYWDNLI